MNPRNGAVLQGELLPLEEGPHLAVLGGPSLLGLLLGASLRGGREGEGEEAPEGGAHVGVAQGAGLQHARLLAHQPRRPVRVKLNHPLGLCRAEERPGGLTK